MRYLLTMIMVLVLGSPAMSICTTPDKELEVDSDCDLPDSSGPYNVVDCDSLDFRVSFFRTKHDQPPTILIFTIEGAGMSASYRSWDYTHGSHSDSGSAMVTDSSYPYENNLIITRITAGPGCNVFADMKLEAFDYR